MKHDIAVRSFAGLLATLLLAGCGGGGGDATGSPPPPPPPAATVTLTSSAASIASGESVTLTWSSTDATSCTASGAWTGTKFTSGSEVVGPLTASSSYTLSCSGAGGTSDRTASIVVVAQAALHITSGAPPNGTVGVFYNRGNGQTCFYLNGHSGYCYPCYVGASTRSCPAGYVYQNSFAFRAVGGAPPYIWAAVGLPPGLTVNADGTFYFSKYCCKPQSAGTYDATVTVTDSGSPAVQASATYSIVIAPAPPPPPPPPPSIITPATTFGTINLPYTFAFTSVGQPPFAWSETGALPPGLTFTSDGTLSGTPTALGSFAITLMVQDATGRNATPQEFSIQILAHGFMATGSMGTDRYRHSATLLANGQVLVVGGEGANAGVTAELFDPANGTFTPTGSMAVARTEEHAATLLKDGRVLVIGGRDPTGNALASAELFDPVSGAFTPAGNMAVARRSHSATLLEDGRVLVVGGYADVNGTPLTSAELFDPASGTFTSTGSLGMARLAHSATLLTTGQVLVIGGYGDASGTVLASAELFDPASGSFAPTGSLGTERGEHTATLLTNGQVLVAGGAVDASGTIFAGAELFDPVSGSFTSTGSLVTARIGHTATLGPDGQVLLVGGVGSSSYVLSTAELFDPANRVFTLAGAMATARYWHTATLLKTGAILVTGGVGISTAELFQ